jgi:hypothetical protein
MDNGYKIFVLRAQQCREAAKTANNPVEKETWLAIAEEYLYLAQAVGKQNEKAKASLRRRKSAPHSPLDIPVSPAAIHEKPC